MLATTVRAVRDLDVAEEATADAFVQALRTWPADGVPDRPGAWLATVARRLALNMLRRRATLARKLPDLVVPDAPHADEHLPDDRLRLVFTCCHPALAEAARLALTLRFVCGMSTADVAHALLVSTPTMAARLTRAKQKIAAARIPFAVPGPDELPARVDTVLTVVHVLAAAGHTAPSGDALQRSDLAARALDLARMLRLLLPADGEVAGLLALLLVHEARRPTRTGDDGRLVRLEDQDRSRWDRTLIAEADALISEVLRTRPPGRFVLQAAIASLHAHAPTAAATDWLQILALYDELAKVWPSPVVALNRAVALAEVDGPHAALAEVERLEADVRLRTYAYLPAVRADLLGRLGRDDEAAAAYRAALDLTGNAVEREFLLERLA